MMTSSMLQPDHFLLKSIIPSRKATRDFIAAKGD